MKRRLSYHLISLLHLPLTSTLVDRPEPSEEQFDEMIDTIAEDILLFKTQLQRLREVLPIPKKKLSALSQWIDLRITVTHILFSAVRLLLFAECTKADLHGELIMSRENNSKEVYTQHDLDRLFEPQNIEFGRVMQASSDSLIAVSDSELENVWKLVAGTSTQLSELVLVCGRILETMIEVESGLGARF